MRTSLKILVLAPNSWKDQWVNRQQLMSRLGKRHAILYSTGGWFSWDRSSEEWQKADWLGSILPYDNVWVDDSPRFLLRFPRLHLDKLVMRLQTMRWRRFLETRGPGPVVAYLFHPSFYPYAGLMK